MINFELDEKGQIIVMHISKIVNTEDGISGVGKSIHQQQGIVVEAVDIWVVEENVSIAFSWVRTGDVCWRFFDNLYFSSCLAGMEVS